MLKGKPPLNFSTTKSLLVITKNKLTRMTQMVTVHHSQSVKLLQYFKSINKMVIIFKFSHPYNLNFPNTVHHAH